MGGARRGGGVRPPLPVAAGTQWWRAPSGGPHRREATILPPSAKWPSRQAVGRAQPAASAARPRRRLLATVGAWRRARQQGMAWPADPWKAGAARGTDTLKRQPVWRLPGGAHRRRASATDRERERLWASAGDAATTTSASVDVGTSGPVGVGGVGRHSDPAIAVRSITVAPARRTSVASAPHVWCCSPYPSRPPELTAVYSTGAACSRTRRPRRCPLGASPPGHAPTRPGLRHSAPHARQRRRHAPSARPLLRGAAEALSHRPRPFAPVAPPPRPRGTGRAGRIPPANLREAPTGGRAVGHSTVVPLPAHRRRDIAPARRRHARASRCGRRPRRATSPTGKF